MVQNDYILDVLFIILLAIVLKKSLLRQKNNHSVSESQVII